MHFSTLPPALSPSPNAPIPSNLSPEQANHILGRYGLESDRFFKESQPEEFAWIGASCTSLAELRWAAREEGVIHLDDLLLRRTRFGITNPQECINQMPVIRDIIQQESGWDDQRWQDEYLAYTKLWKDCYAPIL